MPGKTMVIFFPWILKDKKVVRADTFSVLFISFSLCCTLCTFLEKPLGMTYSWGGGIKTDEWKHFLYLDLSFSNFNRIGCLKEKAKKLFFDFIKKKDIIYFYQ